VTPAGGTEAADLKQRFGANLRAARMAADLSIEALAGRCDMHWTAVARLEEGRSEPSLGMVLRLAEAVEVAPEQLWAEPS